MIHYNGSDWNLRALHEAARRGMSDEHLLALALPDGYSLGYGSSDCETCGYNFDEVTWYFHGNNSVSYKARFGCYSGGYGERATFDEVLRDLPSFAPFEDGDNTPTLDMPHLHQLWQDHALLLDAIKGGKEL